MASRRSSAAVAAASFAVLIATSPVARGAGEINQQVLQGVGAFSDSSALDMLFDAPATDRPPDFEKFNLAGFASLRSCQRNATRGLYCLDGAVVRRWTDPEIGGASQDPPEFSCANSKLKLTGPEYCTALAIAQNGDAWIAGRRKGASVLIRLREKSDGTAGEAQGRPARARFARVPRPLSRATANASSDCWSQRLVDACTLPNIPLPIA